MNTTSSETSQECDGVEKEKEKKNSHKVCFFQLITVGFSLSTPAECISEGKVAILHAADSNQWSVCSTDSQPAGCGEGKRIKRCDSQHPTRTSFYSENGTTGSRLCRLGVVDDSDTASAAFLPIAKKKTYISFQFNSGLPRDFFIFFYWAAPSCRTFECRLAVGESKRPSGRSEREEEGLSISSPLAPSI